MYQQYIDQGLIVIAAGFDWNQPYSCTSWGSTFGLTYPILDDTQNTVWNMYGMGYIPHNVVIDHTMTVRYTDSGFSQTAIANTIQTYLDALPNDLDGDGINASEDNCPEIYNPEQEDVDGDGMGDACDPCDNANVFISGNVNGDMLDSAAVIDIFDVLSLIDIILSQDFEGCQGEAANFNGDQTINVLDAVQLVNFILNGGPAGVTPAVIDNGVKVSLNRASKSSELVFSDGNSISGLQFTVPDLVLEEFDETSVNLPEGWILRAQTVADKTTFVVMDLSSNNARGEISLELPIALERDLEDLVISDADGNSLKPQPAKTRQSEEEELDLQPVTLSGLYPNPFNPDVTIPFVLTQDMDVSVTVYDIVGKQITSLQDGPMLAGEHQLRWRAVDMPSGVYFIQIQAGGAIHTQKAVLMK